MEVFVLFGGMRCSKTFCLLVIALGTGIPITASAATGTSQPTEAEQYLLQVLNRARANGTTEMVRLGNTGSAANVNEGPPTVGGESWTIQIPIQPVAWNTALASAAQSHCNNLQSADWYYNQSTYGANPHSISNPSFPGGATTAAGRIAAAGFVNTYFGARRTTGGSVPGPENVGVFQESPSNGWTNAESLQGYNTAHQGLFQDFGPGFSVPGRGHRCIMMYEWYNEVGFGSNLATDLQSPGVVMDSFYLVQNFGRSSTSNNPFLTGMAYNDVDNNQFFTPFNTETIAGLTVQALQAGSVISSVAAFDTGGYSLRLAPGTYEIRFVKANGSNYSAGNVVLDSQNVELNVRNPLFVSPVFPVITTHPASTSINTGTTTTLSVVATGTPAPAYQWYQGTSPSTTTPVGTNSSSFTTPALSIATSYWVKVTNTEGSANSNTAVVSINQPAAIGSHPASVGINSGQTTVLSVTATGTGPFTYQWYRGTSPSTTTTVGTNSSSFTTPALSTATSYWVKVTNVANSAGANSNTAVVSINQAPAISSHPASVAIGSGQSTVLNVTATGTPAPSYQWYQGTSPSTTTPVGTNSSSFTTPALSTATSYWVKVTNTFGNVNSNTAVVSIMAPYDAWKTFYFTPAQLANPLFSGPTADPDGDGASNDNEYVFGTVPTVSETAFNPVLTKTAIQFTLGFTARSATGTGYAGKTRHYAIESATDPSQAVWPLVAGYEDIVATGQNVSYTAPITPGKKIFRLKVWLTP